jgi:hypothetical protein
MHRVVEPGVLTPGDHIDTRHGDVAVHPRSLQPPPTRDDRIWFYTKWQAVKHINHQDGVPASPKVGKRKTEIGIQKGGKCHDDRVGRHRSTRGKRTGALRMPLSGIENGVKHAVELMTAYIRSKPPWRTAQHHNARAVAALQHRLHELRRAARGSLGRRRRRAQRLRIAVDENNKVGGAVREPVGDM